MNNIDIANGIIFQKMGVSKESFDDRLICQKKIYLLQSLGTDLGYSYTWYLRGPYSPALASYVYTNAQLLTDTNFDNYEISSKATENINRVNCLESKKTEKFTLVSWYELLASLLYIEKNRDSWKIEEGEEALFEKLIEQKPQFDVEQCKCAYTVLADEGFI